MRGGLLLEIVAYERWSPYERWSLMRGGRLLEVVAYERWSLMRVGRL